MAETQLILSTVVKGTETATKALNDVKGSLSSISDKAKSLGDGLEKLGRASAVAFAAFSAIVYKGKAAIDEDAEATNRLTTLLKTASKATDSQVLSLIAQAEALERSTVAGYDMIVTTQSQLATFNLQAKTIERLTPAILDYVIAEKGAAASADEYRSMTQGLAQALNGNFSSLTRSGFILDDHTKKLIKNGTEAQKAEAIYNVLQSTYKGFATDATQTAIGSQIQLNKTLEDVSKLVATAVIPIINELKIKVLSVAQEVLKWAEANPELTKKIILVTGAVTALGASLLIILPILTGLITTIKLAGVVIAALASPIGIAIAVVTAFAAAGWYMYKNWDTIKTNLSLLWAQIKKDVESGWNKILEVFSVFTEAIPLIFNDLIASAKQWGTNMINMFIEGINSKIQGVKDSVLEISTTISDYLGFHSPTKKGPASDSDKWMPNFVNMIVNGLKAGVDPIEKVANSMASKLKSLGQSVKIDDLKNSLSSLAQRAKDALSGLTSKMDESRNKVAALKDEIKSLNDKLKELGQEKISAQQEGVVGIAGRAAEIQDEIAALKTNAYISEDERIKKLNELTQELSLAKSIVTEEDIRVAILQRQKSQTQLMIDDMRTKLIQIDTEIFKTKELITQKQQAIANEEQAYWQLNKTRIDLENSYYALFSDHMGKMQNSIQNTINMMERLNRLMRGPSAATPLSGARASGGPVSGGGSYLVGEKGPEIFTPSSSGNIIPNNKIAGVGGNIVINITGMFGSDAVGEISDAIVTNLKRASYI